MNNNSTKSVYDFYKLKNWISPKRICWRELVSSKNAIPFIEKHIDVLKIDCLKKLSRNPFAAEMLKNYLDKISWNDFVNNPNAIHIIDKHFDLCFQSINWRGRLDLLRHPDFIHILKKYENKIIDELLFSDCLTSLAEIINPKYIELLEKYMNKYPEKIEREPSCFWKGLCKNPYAIHLIKQNLNKLTIDCWNILANNPNAIPLLEENLDKINDNGWRNLSENPNAIPILEKNPDKINWYCLSSNPNGIPLIEKYPDKINYLLNLDCDNFSVNLPIFEIDYDAIEKRCSIYKEELMEIALHPSRIEKYLNQGIPFKDLDNYI